MSQSSSVDEQVPPGQTKKAVDQFLEEFDKISSAEERLRAAVDFMRSALSSGQSPDFRGFWEVRKRSLPLFKEALPPAMRAQLWEDYIELTREGRRLKNVLDDESAFAVEQIDIAIHALEEELEKYSNRWEELLATAPDVKFPKEPKAVQGRYPYYGSLQKRLNFLNAFAVRINSLRKELIKTEMRLRQKNSFFQRLSKLGDIVFPLRRELIKEVSEAFMKDVDAFVSAHFSEQTFSKEKVQRSVFFYREEIKTLQACAKILTLNTQTFSEARTKLSGCWDMLKGMDKELKKELTQQKHKSEENTKQVLLEIEKIKLSIDNTSLTAADALKALDELLLKMREIELTRQDVRLLKENIHNLRTPLEEQLKAQQSLKEQEVEERRNQQKEELKGKLASLLKRVAQTPLEELTRSLQECQEQLKTLFLRRTELEEFKKSLQMLRDQIAEKEEEAVLTLSDDDRAALDGLHALLEQRKERRQQIRAQIEEYRKVMGGSTLDFEKGLQMQELMAAERERLEKIDHKIAEIEQKIRQLKKKT